MMIEKDSEFEKILLNENIGSNEIFNKYISLQKAINVATNTNKVNYNNDYKRGFIDAINLVLSNINKK